ncbi:titin-like isoform X17 [Ostrea edulis]|uniref:titin-like isoform X17 n=1 Tax=Ostrea edulis TaxID=37623 RepID=UPI0024AFC0F7|nr:titin-like isoform X17 [Ostrea edulis]
MRPESVTMKRANMKKQMNLEHLSDEECEKILQVLQKDFELREKEKDRLHKIEEVLKEEEEKTEVLAVKTKLNEEVCVRCCQKFGIIFNRKQLCLTCKLYVCKRCADYSDNEKGYTCHACSQEREQLEEHERELKLKSFDWFYNNVSQKFKRFGSAKVVRSLYKQRGARGRAYHTDNESDGGYDPTFLTSLRSAVRGGRGGDLSAPEFGDVNLNSDVETEIESIGPAPISTTTLSRASSVETLNHSNRKNYYNNSTAEVQVDNIPKEKSKEDIYKEAFEHYKETEEKKFNSKFSSFLHDLHQSLEQPVLNGGSSYGSTSYGEVLEKYKSRLRELLVGVSQRLEMAVESFDSNPCQSASDTSQKVKKLVSKLVEESFGESIDVTSDEAVSDLSSLSDDSCDNQVKSFEDQLAHAVVARVLENFGRDRNIDIPLDYIDGNALTNQVTDGRSHDSDNKSHPDLTSRGASSDEENSVVTKVERRSHSGYSDSGRLDVDDLDVSDSVSDSENRLHPADDSVSRDVLRPVCGTLDDSSFEVISVKDLDLENHEDLVACEKVDQRISGEVEEEDITTESVHTNNIHQDFEELRRIAKDIQSPRHELQTHEIQEEIEFDEEPIEPVTVNREESKSEFVSRLSTYDRLHDTEKYLLPDFSDDYEDNEFFQNEVDPDLLSMNLAPILEEDEENYQEEENEEETSLNSRSTEERSWRDNWIFNRSNLSPYSSLGGGGLAGRTLDEVYLTVPQPDDDIAARVGNSADEQADSRDVDQMSDDLSEGHEENLIDDEVSFFAKSVDEIARITTRMTSSSPYLRPLSSTSVQTIDSDTSIRHTSVSKKSSASRTEPTYIEELIPAEGDDPKFDIPPESVTIKEGEPAKFSCRVSGTEPIDVIWYKVEDGDLQQLEDSEDYEFTQDNNRHGATVFNTAKSMAGQLMCMAINEKAHCSQSFILKIRSNNQEMKKPEFLKEIEDQEVKEGHHVKFRAKVKGYPLPRVVWYKDGNLLKNDTNYKIEKFGNRDYLLNIEYATPDDDAEYWVVAKNVAGETKSTAQLIVQSKELDASPKTNVMINSTPIKSKDDQQLSNMGRKLFMTHEKVQEETQSMVESANKKDAASNIRNTTSSALQLLKSTENLINTQPDEDLFATSSPQESTLSPTSQQDQVNNNVLMDIEINAENVVSESVTNVPHFMKSNEKNAENIISEPITNVPHLDLSEHSEMTDNDHVTYETVKEPASRILQKSVIETRLSNEDEEPSVVNFGPKEISEELYGRDFYVQGEKKNSPRHWEVKVPQFSPRGSRVVPQESLQATEEEVVNVERQLDLNSCPSITTGHTTEESISSLSPSLSIDSGFSSIREKPQQTQMFGESSEMDIPESRTEFNEEMGVAELPSVNRLKALFSTGKGNDSSSVKRVSRR